MQCRLSEYIPEQAVFKELLWNFYSRVCVLKIGRVYSFKGALKTHVLLAFLTKRAKGVNENTEGVSRALCKF